MLAVKLLAMTKPIVWVKLKVRHNPRTYTSVKN